ncbi:MAG: hypothetical protein ACREA3_07060 [Nitrosotalea sp.]
MGTDNLLGNNYRSMVLFNESIKSKATHGTYMFGLERFRAFYKLKSFDGILTIEPKKLQIMVEDYVFDLKKRVSPNSIPYLRGLEHFFTMNDVMLNWKKIYKLYPDRVKPGGSNAYTTKDILLMR